MYYATITKVLFDMPAAEELSCHVTALNYPKILCDYLNTIYMLWIKCQFNSRLDPEGPCVEIQMTLTYISWSSDFNLQHTGI